MKRERMTEIDRERRKKGGGGGGERKCGKNSNVFLSLFINGRISISI